MQEVREFLSANEKDIYKKAVYRLVPNLAGHEIEVVFRQMLVCPLCGKEGACAYFYRSNNSEAWKQAGKVYSCSECRDKEEVYPHMDRDKKEQERIIADRLMNHYFLLPEKLRELGFKDYLETNPVNTVAKQQAISYIKSFLSSDKERYNLLFQGNPGTGKTHLCVAIARNLKEKGFIVGFLTMGQLLAKIKSTYNKASMITEENIIKDLKKLDLLILDDLGSEATGGNDDWRKSIIFEVVESRSGKPTIYTSNLTEMDLSVAVGERVSSRLYDNTKFIDLFSEDYRKRLQIKHAIGKGDGELWRI